MLYCASTEDAVASFAPFRVFAEAQLFQSLVQHGSSEALAHREDSLENSPKRGWKLNAFHARPKKTVIPEAL